MKLFALLIGINQYSPASEIAIPALNGCINDVSHVRELLFEEYSHLIQDPGQIQLLLNEKATRNGVINGFQKHLCQAGPDDLALLYYSGHGSCGLTAPEFHALSNDSQEQTWVLYDSREPQQYDLADKEIALLLDGLSANGPKIIVIADSCHSGSVTREIEEFRQFCPRFTSAADGTRSLASYLDGAYIQRGHLVIPSPDHLLLAACDRTERAWEGDGEGQFSKSLLDILRVKGGQISYADLFKQTRGVIQSLLKNQTPQLEIIGSFDTGEGFLGSEVPAGIAMRYLVFFEGGHWQIDLGAAMGIDSASTNPIPILLFDGTGPEAKLCTKAVLSELNITRSLLRVDTMELDTCQIYWGQPELLQQSPFRVYAKDVTRDLLSIALTRCQESGILLITDLQNAGYRVDMENNVLLITDIAGGKLIQGIKGTDAASANEALHFLERLASFERLLLLSNPGSAFLSMDAELQMIVTIAGVEHSFEGPLVTLDYENSPIPFQVKLFNNGRRPFYATLLHLSSAFGVEILYSDSQPLSAGAAVVLLQDTLVLEVQTEETDILKLIVSSELIDSALFARQEIRIGEIATPGQDRALGSSRRLATSRSDWFTQNITIRLVKKSTQILGEQEMALGMGIRIGQHPNFRANLNFTSLGMETRGLELSVLEDRYFSANPFFQVLDLSNGSREAKDNRLLEIANIHHVDSLKLQPLIVTLPQDRGELVLPFFFDGEDLLLAGDLYTNLSGEIRVEVSSIPAEYGPAGSRSLGSSIRLLFVKFAHKAGLHDKPYRLAWADYGEDGLRKTDGLSDRISASRKILLLIHGIIGDTEEMAKTFKLAKDHGYDLVLTWDYENLNTSIEDNAELLLEQLKAEGFDPQDGRELVIVAHSMGGLVARYLIENLGGSKFVDQLIMAGTPNHGSKFGNIPNYISWAAVVLGLGVKLFPPQLGSIAGFLSGLLKTTDKVLMPSLRQMAADSPFIKALARDIQAPIPYHILGGDLDAYLRNHHALPFMEKAVARIGTWTYENIRNDIAVATESIFYSPGATTEIVPCHHLNYFVIPDSVESLSRAIDRD